MLLIELPVVTAEGIGLRPSAELLDGGVRRLPTLVSEALGCDELMGKLNLLGWKLDGGGGSSKLGRCDAFGLRAVKLGAPIGSAPGIIDGG